MKAQPWHFIWIFHAISTSFFSARAEKCYNSEIRELAPKDRLESKRCCCTQSPLCPDDPSCKSPVSLGVAETDETEASPKLSAPLVKQLTGPSNQREDGLVAEANAEGITVPTTEESIAPPVDGSGSSGDSGSGSSGEADGTVSTVPLAAEKAEEEKEVAGPRSSETVSSDGNTRSSSSGSDGDGGGGGSIDTETARVAAIMEKPSREQPEYTVSSPEEEIHSASQEAAIVKVGDLGVDGLQQASVAPVALDESQATAENYIVAAKTTAAENSPSSDVEFVEPSEGEASPTRSAASEAVGRAASRSSPSSSLSAVAQAVDSAVLTASDGASPISPSAAEVVETSSSAQGRGTEAASFASYVPTSDAATGDGERAGGASSSSSSSSSEEDSASSSVVGGGSDGVLKSSFDGLVGAEKEEEEAVVVNEVAGSGDRAAHAGEATGSTASAARFGAPPAASSSPSESTQSNRRGGDAPPSELTHSSSGGGGGGGGGGDGADSSFGGVNTEDASSRDPPLLSATRQDYAPSTPQKVSSLSATESSIAPPVESSGAADVLPVAVEKSKEEAAAESVAAATVAGGDVDGDSADAEKARLAAIMENPTSEPLGDPPLKAGPVVVADVASSTDLAEMPSPPGLYPPESAAVLSSSSSSSSSSFSSSESLQTLRSVPSGDASFALPAMSVAKTMEDPIATDKVPPGKNEEVEGEKGVPFLQGMSSQLGQMIANLKQVVKTEESSENSPPAAAAAAATTGESTRSSVGLGVGGFFDNIQFPGVAGSPSSASASSASTSSSGVADSPSSASASSSSASTSSPLSSSSSLSSSATPEIDVAPSSPATTTDASDKVEAPMELVAPSDDAFSSNIKPFEAPPIPHAIHDAAPDLGTATGSPDSKTPEAQLVTDGEVKSSESEPLSASSASSSADKIIEDGGAEITMSLQDEKELEKLHGDDTEAAKDEVASVSTSNPQVNNEVDFGNKENPAASTIAVEPPKELAKIENSVTDPGVDGLVQEPGLALPEARTEGVSGGENIEGTVAAAAADNAPPPETSIVTAPAAPAVQSPPGTEELQRPPPPPDDVRAPPLLLHDAEANQQPERQAEEEEEAPWAEVRQAAAGAELGAGQWRPTNDPMYNAGPGSEHDAFVAPPDDPPRGAADFEAAAAANVPPASPPWEQLPEPPHFPAIEEPEASSVSASAPFLGADHSGGGFGHGDGAHATDLELGSRALDDGAVLPPMIAASSSSSSSSQQQQLRDVQAPARASYSPMYLADGPSVPSSFAGGLEGNIPRAVDDHDGTQGPNSRAGEFKSAGATAASALVELVPVAQRRNVAVGGAALVLALCAVLCRWLRCLRGRRAHGGIGHMSSSSSSKVSSLPGLPGLGLGRKTSGHEKKQDGAAAGNENGDLADGWDDWDSGFGGPEGGNGSARGGDDLESGTLRSHSDHQFRGASGDGFASSMPKRGSGTTIDALKKVSASSSSAQQHRKRNSGREGLLAVANSFAGSGSGSGGGGGSGSGSGGGGGAGGVCSGGASGGSLLRGRTGSGHSSESGSGYGSGNGGGVGTGSGSGAVDSMSRSRSQNDDDFFADFGMAAKPAFQRNTTPTRSRVSSGLRSPDINEAWSSMPSPGWEDDLDDL